MSALLQIDGVGKSFGGLKAVQNVSLSVTEGRLSALIPMVRARRPCLR